MFRTYRTRLRQAALGAAAAALLSACATQGPVRPGVQPGPRGPAPDLPAQVTPEMAAAAETLTRMAALQERLYKVAAPLLIDNAELCTRHARNLLGFTAKNRYAYPGSYNAAAHAVLGMGERLQVSNVLVGSGAAKAGLRQGDELVA
ncbi:MAG: peptidase M48, partial [Telluria sp.]